MQPIKELNVLDDVGRFRAETSSGTAYEMSRATAGDTWWVKRYPAPGAGALWIDAGGPIDHLECRVGESARFDTAGGLLSMELWAVSSTILSITRLPD